MLKLHDFRHGGFFLVEGFPYVLSFRRFHSFAKSTTAEMEIIMRDYKGEGGVPIKDAVLGEIRPLPIKDAWIQSFGFSDDEVSSDFSTEYSLLGFEKHFAIIHLHKDDEYWLEIGCEHDREWARKKVSFVHELQSIFYDHTGHSLTHNLKR